MLTTIPNMRILRKAAVGAKELVPFCRQMHLKAAQRASGTNRRVGNAWRIPARVKT